jgi:hypothetical protein
MTYTQRYEIQVYLKHEKKQNYTAEMLQVGLSSISRDIERNSAPNTRRQVRSRRSTKTPQA